MKSAVLLSLSLLLSVATRAAEAVASPTIDSAWQKELASYNVAWTTQSKNSSESMPLAGGILGLNVWTENGEVCFLIGSPNCLDENGMQVKLGLLRLHFDPAVFEKDFRQELHLGQSEIVVSGRTADGSPVTVKLWCGVEHPLIHIETMAGEPVSVTATYETWSGYEAKPDNGTLVWHRRLAERNARREKDMQAQGMTEFAKSVPDPLSRLTCGGRLTGPGMIDAGTGIGTFNKLPTRTYSIKTAAPVKQLDLCVTLRMEQDASLADWDASLSRDSVSAVQGARTEHASALAWWNTFWDRSHITINPGAGDADVAWRVARNYQLFRYQLAANRNGRAMTLFNGGVFPCEGNPDTRMWDGCQFMAQNQRPMAWAELKTGDYDLLKVSLDFYRDRTEASRLHARKFWAVEGVAYPEPFSIFGLDSIGTTKEGRSAPDHLHYHYTSGMEFALIMLEYGRFSGENIADLLEPAEGIIHYYDQYYQKVHAVKTGKPLDEDGKLVIYPSDACEPFHGCTNNTDVICGLEALSQALIDLPGNYLTPQNRAWYKEFQKRIPPLPMAEKDGKPYVAAARSYEWVFYNGNMDFPNMYVCFPFNHFFLGRPDNGIELARNTWDFGAIRPDVQRQVQCWYQSSINLARMGRAQAAAQYTIKKLTGNPSLRFPAFWTNYGFCHAPDTDHGATAMIGLQEMIMQTDGKRILLGPAWPAEWAGTFKLHAPFQTIVEGHVADGKVTVDKVIPESRRKDIEICPLQAAPPKPVSEGKPATASSVYGDGYRADKAFDGNPDSRWSATAESGKEGWLQVDLEKPTSISRVMIQETTYARVSKFAIEAQLANGTWKDIVDGTVIGAGKALAFPAVEAQKWRLHVFNCTENGPTINELQFFAK